MKRPWKYTGQGIEFDTWLKWLVFVVLPLFCIIVAMAFAEAPDPGRRDPYWNLPPMDQLDMWYEDELLREKGMR